MAPVMNRQDTRARAERAFQLRALGRTWAEIADHFGFRTREGAIRAVQRYMAQMPAESPEAARRSITERLRIISAALLETFADAKTRDDTDTMVAVSKELRGATDSIIRLNGLNVPVAQKVDINISQSPQAIIDRMETELLAVLDKQERQLPAAATAQSLPALPVIDAEVAELAALQQPTRQPVTR